MTVFIGGGMQMPSLFMLGLVYRLITDESNDEGVNLWGIWSAFAGGLLWDIRWVGIPGFFTLGYVAVVLAVIQVWGIIPPQGRNFGESTSTGLIVFILMEISQLIPPLLPVLILGGAAGWRFFLTQQIYSLPAILFCLYIYDRKMKNRK